MRWYWTKNKKNYWTKYAVKPRTEFNMFWLMFQITLKRLITWNLTWILNGLLMPILICYISILKLKNKNFNPNNTKASSYLKKLMIRVLLKWLLTWKNKLHTFAFGLGYGTCYLIIIMNFHAELWGTVVLSIKRTRTIINYCEIFKHVQIEWH